MDSKEIKPSSPSHQQLQASTLGIEQNQNPQQPEKRKLDSDGDGGGNANSDDPPAKRGRGRPPSSEGFGFTPHVIEVEMGEDIVSKVMEFSDQGERSVFILSASGAVSSVMLSGTVTYEGRFEIIALSGLFVNRSGSLTLVFARPDGQVACGIVIGSLVAATKVMVIVGSILLETKKRISSENSGGQNQEPASVAANRLSRGKPPRSGEKQLGILKRTKGFGLPTHIIEVEIGEDIASKVKEFSDQGPRSVFIICARGYISNVTLSRNAIVYEGRFPIITLSGSFVSGSGSLTVAFAGPYDQLISGVVNGSLVAATKVEVLVESIVLKTKNSAGQNQEPTSTTANRLSTESCS